MYSAAIIPKVEGLFRTLRGQVAAIVSDSVSSEDAIAKATKLISAELSSRSKSILSDMLFALSDALLRTDFFADIARQNRFYECNLRQEILSKYQFSPNSSVQYQEASRTVQALKMGGIVLAVGGGAKIGAVLVAGLLSANPISIPISVLIVASIGAVVVEYYTISPTKNKKKLTQILDRYLIELQQQFLHWFDEVEKYFYQRAEEIKQTL